jgi:hypothetical protein
MKACRLSGYPTGLLMEGVSRRFHDRLLVTASFSNTYSAEYKKPSGISVEDAPGLVET